VGDTRSTPLSFLIFHSSFFIVTLYEPGALESQRFALRRLIETHALLLSRSRDGHANAIKFLDMIASDAYRVERIRKADEAKAIALVRAHQDKEYSLCDALSFTVLERLRIREAIAFDRHFRAYGRSLIL